MKATQAIEEIREARVEISRKCDFSSKKLVDYYVARQKKRQAAESTKPWKRLVPCKTINFTTKNTKSTKI